jgi:hypothetical protein
MVRITLLAALVAGLIIAPASAGPTSVVASHCSRSGDVCYGIFKPTSGLYRFKLTLAAKYFSRYRICVRPPGRVKSCKRFAVRKTGANWGGSVIWQRNFPVNGPGIYRVTWLQSGHRLGPTLELNLPAPA